MLKTCANKHSHDGIDRRGFLECMAWAGTGVLCTMAGGILSSKQIGLAAEIDTSLGGFTFVQISDSHLGFKREPNQDVAATLETAVARINALPMPPDFIIHTGDISHLSAPGEFDAADQILRKTRAGRIFFVPGEHDVLTDAGQSYLARYGKGTKGSGWYSFDHKGVRFIGLVNVLNLRPGGLGFLGSEQLDWLRQDVSSLPASTPIVVFAHMPLWSIYPEWGWGTDDSEQALGLLKRFGSVTVLNGHIHQVMQKVEGSATFHTAASTAFPQPAPGMAAGPGPLKVPAERLRAMLGLADVRVVTAKSSLAIIDSTLDSAAGSSAKQKQVTIDNFSFTPSTLTVDAGTTVTWINNDDVPHTVVETMKRFHSEVLDTDGKYAHTFDRQGTFDYFCSVHPHMTGKVVVQ